MSVLEILSDIRKRECHKDQGQRTTHTYQYAYANKPTHAKDITHTQFRKNFILGGLSLIIYANVDTRGAHKAHTHSSYGPSFRWFNG